VGSGTDKITLYRAKDIVREMFLQKMRLKNWFSL